MEIKILKSRTNKCECNIQIIKMNNYKYNLKLYL